MKSFVFAMAFFGYVHFTSSLIGALHRRKLSDLNPYHLINIDRFLGGAGKNGFAFAFGWLFFFGITAGFYLLLSRDR